MTKEELQEIQTRFREVGIEVSLERLTTADHIAGQVEFSSTEVIAQMHALARRSTALSLEDKIMSAKLTTIIDILFENIQDYIKRSIMLHDVVRAVYQLGYEAAIRDTTRGTA